MSAVDSFFENSEKFREPLEALREILLDCGLEETVKWKQPCYTWNGNNVAILGELKECCVMGFFKGALLADNENILSKPGEHTQAARTIRFKDAREVKKMEKLVKTYIYEAIEIEKAGLKVDFKEKKELVLPEELLAIFAKDPALKKAFYALTPGRQRAYNLFFSAAKQSRTRIDRIRKYAPKIMQGKGMNDYK